MYTHINTYHEYQVYILLEIDLKFKVTANFVTTQVDFEITCKLPTNTYNSHVYCDQGSM